MIKKYKNMVLPYNPYLRKLVRELRKNGTLGEVLLWKGLKNKSLGCEFHRQVPIDEFIVDFFCHEYMLAIEVDGSTHQHEINYANDMKRQHKIEQLGVRFLRFQESDIRSDVDTVLLAIEQWIKDNT